MNPPGQGGHAANELGAIHAAHGMAGVIIGALAFVFIMHYLGFRFVVAAGVGGG
jgi:hypothetical protein